MKYKLSTGAVITENCVARNGGAYEVIMSWFGKEIPTVFTPDDDDEENLDAAVETFERTYKRREYYYMLARNILKMHHLEKVFKSDEEYEDYVISTEMRDDRFLGQYGIFEEFLAEAEMTLVVLGNEDEVIFVFYDYSRDQYFDVIGTSADGFFKVKSHDEYDDE